MAAGKARVPARPSTPATPTAASGAAAAKRPARKPATTKAARPVLLVLAGVNGAGKSSIGGHFMLHSMGMPWFNPDRYTRMLAECGEPLEQANARAWQHGVDLIDQAIENGHDHAFETTLGGSTMARKIAQAAQTHDVLVWFCGLSSPEQHIARVAARVAAGGHDIAQAKIRERWVNAPLNLIGLMPCLSELRVYDNSAEAAQGQAVPDPLPVLHVRSGAVQYPCTLKELERTPAWAKPIVKAARDLQRP